MTWPVVLLLAAVCLLSVPYVGGAAEVLAQRGYEGLADFVHFCSAPVLPLIAFALLVWKAATVWG